MDKMIVKVPVTIKAKVTEDLKAQLIADMKRQVQAAELDFERFQFCSDSFFSFSFSYEPVSKSSSTTL